MHELKFSDGTCTGSKGNYSGFPLSPMPEQENNRFTDGVVIHKSPAFRPVVLLFCLNPWAVLITEMASRVIMPNTTFICLDLGFQQKGNKNGFQPRDAFAKRQSKQKEQKNDWPEVLNKCFPLITLSGETEWDDCARLSS